MPKSEVYKKMDSVISCVSPLLRELKYKKRGHTYNRTIQPGLIHVINFQMGKYEGENYQEIPPYRVNLYGKFTINIGVYIEEVHNLLCKWKVTNFISEPDCEIRKRIGELIDKGHDLWWDLNYEESVIGTDIKVKIEKFIIPFLARFSSTDQIIREWEIHGNGIGFPPRGRLSIAILFFYRGDKNIARDLIMQEYNENITKPYASFVMGVAEQLDIEL